MTTEMRLSARGIKKAFGQNPILRGVDVELPKGEFGVLVGPSGCGKSTLLRIVAGLEEVDGGTIEIAGRDVTSLPPKDRDIAMVFQSYALYPHLTVRQNLAFGLTLRKTAASEIESRVKEASAMLGLEKLLDRLPRQLSGGQRQRVAMGRAIVRRPSLFLFDEPLSNLDAALRSEVRVTIRSLHDRLDATTLYVTHDQVEAMTLGDKLWVLSAGRVEQTGAPLDVYARPRTKFVAGFLGSPQMNFVDVKIVHEGNAIFAEGAGVRTALSSERFGGVPKDTEATLGLRPHDARIAEKDASCTLLVDLVEALGFEAYVHGKTVIDGASEKQGQKMIVRLDAEAGRRVRAGEKLPLAFDPDHLHLFDKTSGVALDDKNDKPSGRALVDEKSAKTATS
jgi:sn-glycerol 3-phosphate transport system ATP-binding protein/multiple sugar transport system ATP-binding protein